MNGKEKKFTRAGDEANRYGALWTMPLVLPLVFFLSDSFYSVAFFFCSGFFLSGSLCPLSLSLVVSVLCFFSSLSVFVRLCFFSDLLFKGGGGWYTWRQSWCLSIGWLVLSSLCFCFSLIRLLSDLPSLGLFFLSFVLLCLLALPFAFCVYRSLHVFCVSTLCLSPVLVFIRPLVFLCLSPGSFLFSFPLFRSSRDLPPFVVAFL